MGLKMAAKNNLALESRVDRRKRRNRDALIEAADKVMTKKGIEAATMLEIAELADVGARNSDLRARRLSARTRSGPYIH
jgi:Bacterial regulatory proteins, tetR family